MLTIQIQTIGGQFIRNARWKINSHAYLAKDQDYFISVNVEDKEFLEDLKRLVGKDRTISLERYDLEELKKLKNKKGTGHYLVLSFKISNIKHMFDIDKDELESIVILNPNSRIVEGLILYIYEKDKCDPRFVKFLKGD